MTRLTRSRRDKKTTKANDHTRHRSGYVRLIIGLVVGFILLMIPLGFDLYLQQQSKPVVEQYKKNYPTVPNKSIQKAKAYNKKIIPYQQAYDPSLKPDFRTISTEPHRAIGTVTIPAINVKSMLMYFGDSDWVLNHGVGTLDWTTLPVGGKSTRSVITGHSGLANRIYFDNIRYLKKGDIIYVNTFGRRLAYSVTHQKVIDPNDAAERRKLNVTPGKDEVVLLTCTPIFINTDRLLVYAKRVPLKRAKAHQTVRRDLFSLDHIWIALVLLFILLLIAWYIWHNRKEAKKREKERRGPRP